jgi:hypothetical protein
MVRQTSLCNFGSATEELTETKRPGTRHSPSRCCRREFEYNQQQHHHDLSAAFAPQLLTLKDNDDTFLKELTVSRV